jgi:hypothetical protein
MQDTWHPFLAGAFVTDEGKTTQTRPAMLGDVTHVGRYRTICSSTV